MKNRTQLSLLTATLFCGAMLMAQDYDGIKDGSIATVTREEISGARTIDATGQVVAPGFIDLRAHGRNMGDSLLPLTRSPSWSLG